MLATFPSKLSSIDNDQEGGNPGKSEGFHTRRHKVLAGRRQAWPATPLGPKYHDCSVGTLDQTADKILLVRNF